MKLVGYEWLTKHLINMRTSIIHELDDRKAELDSRRSALEALKVEIGRQNDCLAELNAILKELGA